MLRYLTAGESHGKGLTAIVEGLPSGVAVDRKLIGDYMAARQSGYGRGARQRIETDSVEILSGVRNGLTIGSPVTLFIVNRDYENWREVMGDETADVTKRTVTAPRPGHADLVGSLKYGFSDCRNVLERASARETAARVAAGALAMCFLRQLGVSSVSRTVRIGNAVDDGVYSREQAAERVFKSPVRAVSAAAEKAMMKEIDRATAAGDTVGGKAEVIISGLKSGLGSYQQYDRKFDAAVAAALMSVQAVKAVEFGAGERFAESFGSEILDEIYFDGSAYRRRSNNCGGVEGGMTNGEDVVVSAVMKPIPTLKRSLATVDITTGQPVTAAYERSDVCAVPALSVICECVVCFETARFVLEEVKGSDFAEIERRWKESRYL